MSVEAKVLGETVGLLLDLQPWLYRPPPRRAARSVAKSIRLGSGRWPGSSIRQSVMDESALTPFATHTVAP